MPELTFDPSVSATRQRLIRELRTKWLNGTVLHYYFMPQWAGSESDRTAVRRAFRHWLDTGIGIDFVEVFDASEAELRIGFDHNGGSWSYLGRDALSIPTGERTMNFGWPLSQTDVDDTALHEIGHALGFPHEHQNPVSGIEWNEEAVYSALAAPPNYWSRSTTYHNIIRKLPAEEYEGSEWDRDSIMHYPFQAGLISSPEEFNRSPLIPAGGLSPVDVASTLSLYPPASIPDVKIEPFVSKRIILNPGEQVDYVVDIKETREYSFATLGDSDTVMVLFEDVDGELRPCMASDDSGQEWNVGFQGKLYPERKYILRARMYWADQIGDFGVVMW